VATFTDHCPSIVGEYTTSKYDNEDADGPYCVGTALLQALERYCVPTDDEASMTVQTKFENQLNSFPGVSSVSTFPKLEQWANATAEQWNRPSPYDDALRSSLPRYIVSLDKQLRTRKMAALDRINWGEFKDYLNKNEQ